MPTANERLASLGIRNQVQVLRYTEHQLQSIRKLLREAEIDLSGKLWRANTDYSKSRLKDMLTATSQYAREIERQLFEYEQVNLLKFGQQQAGQAFSDLDDVLAPLLPKGLGISLTTPDFALIAKAALARPMHGKLLKEWWTEWGDGVQAAVSQKIRLGLAENESIDGIVRSIIGTKKNRYKDGILDLKRRHAEALVRTAVNSVATQAKNDVYEDNDDVIDSIQWNSTLDGSTTPICQARDGKRVAIGGRDQSSIPASDRLTPTGARPPAHVNCRSTIVPVISDWQSLGLEDPPASTRASMNGQVSDKLNYEEWLKGQDLEFIESVLGKTKAQLFLKGQLSLGKFVDRAGNTVSLTQLKAAHPKAWKMAFHGQGGMKKKTPKPKAKPAPVTTPKARPAAATRSAGKVQGAQGVPEVFIGQKTKEKMTMGRLQELLAQIPGAEAQLSQLNAFMAKYKTGTLFASASALRTRAGFKSLMPSFKSWNKKLGDPPKKPVPLPEHLKKYMDDVAVAEDGPVYSRAPKTWGYTSNTENYVVMPTDQQTGAFGAARPSEIPASIAQVIKTRKESTRINELIGSMSQSAAWVDGTAHTRRIITWVHEMGHQVHFRAGTPDMPKWMINKRLTQYSYTNHKEFHAEHFAAWVLNREAMLEWNPDLVKYFDDMMEKVLK